MPHTGTFTMTNRRYHNSSGKRREGLTIDPSYGSRTQGDAAVTSDITNVSKIFFQINGRDPATYANIREFYFEERSGVGYIKLKVAPQLARDGWGSLVADHNRLILHRRDATYATGEGTSSWEWEFKNTDSRPRELEYAKDLFRVMPDQGSPVDTFSANQPLTFTIVDEKVEPRLPVLVKSDGTSKGFPYPDEFEQLSHASFFKHRIEPFLGDDAYRSNDLNEYKHIITVYYNDALRVQNYQFSGTIDEVPNTVTATESPYIGSSWTRGTLEYLTGSVAQGGVEERLYSVSGFDPLVEDGAAVTNTTLPTLAAGESIGLNFDLEVYGKGLITEARPGDARLYQFEKTPNMGPSLIKATNCRALFNVESPFEVTDTTFKIHGAIFAGDFANSSTAKFLPGTTQYRDAMVGKHIRSYDGTFLGLINDIEYRVTTKTKALYDIDLDGSLDALTDGLLVLRYLFGLRNEALVGGTVSETAQRNTSEAVESYIAALLDPDSFISTPYGDRSALDFDADGVADALTDGLLLFRYLFGMTGSALTSSATAINSPIPDEDITAHMNTLLNLQAQVDELNRFVAVEVPGATGIIEEGVNETVITYQPLEGSIRRKPVVESIGYASAVDRFLSAEECHLYIELEEEMQPVANTISINKSIERFGVFPFRGRTSSFTMHHWRGGKNYRVRTNIPPVILEPTFKGVFGVTLGAYIGGGVGVGEILNPTFCHVSGLSAGLHHLEFGTANQVILNENQVSKSDIIVAPSGEPILLEIKRVPGYETIALFYDTSFAPTENCSIELVADNILAVEGVEKFIVTPGTPGKRFKAEVVIQYRRFINGNFEVTPYEHFIEGKVADPITRVTLGPYLADSWSQFQHLITQSSVTNVSLKGTLCLDLAFDIPDAEDFPRVSSGQKGKSYWVQPNQLAKVFIHTMNNCRVENRAAPLKITSSRGEVFSQNNNTRYVASYGVDGLSLIAGEEGYSQFSVAGYLEVRVPWQARSEINSPHNTRTYSFSIQGTHTPEYGLEILNDQGGTRLNLSSEPFRVTASNAGIIGRSENIDAADVTYLNTKTFSIADGYYWKHIYTATGQKDPFNKHKYNHTIEIYWEGEKQNTVVITPAITKSGIINSVSHNQTYYNLNLPIRSDGVLGPRYRRKVFKSGDNKDNGTSGVDYYEVEREISLFRWTTDYFSTAGPDGGTTIFDVHQVPNSTYENIDTAKFIVVNNTPESRVKTEIHPDNERILNKPFEWSIDPNTQQIFPGKIWENVSEEYAKIVIRID